MLGKYIYPSHYKIRHECELKDDLDPYVFFLHEELSGYREDYFIITLVPPERIELWVKALQRYLYERNGIEYKVEASDEYKLVGEPYREIRVELKR